MFLGALLPAQNVKGFYVNNFHTILGNTLREDSILSFAQYHGFNCLTLYNVYQIHSVTPLTNPLTSQSFANFIQKAKTQYNIAEIGVAAESFSFFNNIIHIYNQQHTLATQKVDVYNLEFEFWINASVNMGAYYCTTYLQPNGYTCDNAGAFSYYKKILTSIDSLANSTGQKSEAYFGFFTAAQGSQIVQTGVDRVLLSIYIPSANYSSTYQYNYVKPRLQYLASANSNIKVMPLYSGEPAFMQSWLNTHSFFLPYTDFTNSLSTEIGTWKNNIQPEGIQWFAYSFLPKAFPIEYCCFEANLQEEKTYLSWKTLSEQNASHIEIERSTEKLDFEKIGQIEAQGTVNTPSQYVFVDIYPKNQNEYRLKFVDIDGQYNYSDIINVENSEQKQIYIYPNPTSEIIYIEAYSPIISLALMDMQGKVLKDFTSDWQNGYHSFSVKSLPNGAYILRFVTEKGTSHQQLILMQP